MSIFFLAFLIGIVGAYEQSVGVLVRFICGSNIENSKEAILYSSEETLEENKMTSALTDSEGNLNISGSIDSAQRIKPSLVFQHTCDISPESDCYVLLTIYVPDDFIFEGGLNSIYEYYNISLVNLQNTVFPDNFKISKVCP